MSGAANTNVDGQRKLNFAPSRPAGQHANPQEGAGSSRTNNDDNRSKRGRFELEPTGGNNNNDNNEANSSAQHLRVPSATDITSSESENSLFNSDRDSINTIIDGTNAERVVITPPRENNITTEDDFRPRIIRLERLRDKSDRYSSHIQFLKECRETNVIPKGLKIDIEPSIGNNDEKFCKLWFSRMEQFSKILITDIITYSEGVENTTAIKIDEETAFLRTNMTADEFKECEDKLDYNSTQRRSRLAATKRKKYHHLRYNRPERQQARQEGHQQSRNERNPRPERRQGNTHRDTSDHDDRYDRQQSRSEWQRPERRQDNPRNRGDFEYDDNRYDRPERQQWNNRESHTRERDTQQERPRYSDLLRDDPPPHHRENRTNFGDRQDRNEGNRNRQIRGDDRGDAPSNWLNTRDTRSRPTSRTSLYPGKQAISRGNSRPNLPTEQPTRPNNREQEQPKNGNGPHGGAQAKRTTNEEMKAFIATTMRTLEAFSAQLTN